MIIRGRDCTNPVLLFISGGPGVPEYWLNEYYKNHIEDDFTVCWWDWRGEGLSYDSDIKPEEITTENLMLDAKEVAKYLKERFGQAINQSNLKYTAAYEYLTVKLSGLFLLENHGRLSVDVIC